MASKDGRKGSKINVDTGKLPAAQTPHLSVIPNANRGALLAGLSSGTTSKKIERNQENERQVVRTIFVSISYMTCKTVSSQHVMP